MAEGMAADETRNPPWNRDELILALDAYVRWQGNPPAKTSPDIADLSRAVSDLRQVLGTQGQPTLRNTNGVYMKLMNCGINRSKGWILRQNSGNG